MLSVTYRDGSSVGRRYETIKLYSKYVRTLRKKLPVSNVRLMPSWGGIPDIVRPDGNKALVKRNKVRCPTMGCWCQFVREDIDASRWMLQWAMVSPSWQTSPPTPPTALGGQRGWWLEIFFLPLSRVDQVTILHFAAEPLCS